MIFNKIINFIDYLFSKKSEVKHLNHKDLLLAKVVVDIHRKRTHSEFTYVPLFSIKPIHPINRKSSLLATQKRAEQLKKHHQDIIEKKNISRDFLANHLPSISWIKVVAAEDHSFIAYEGNGRLAAMHKVFKPEDGISVEVEMYHFRNSKKIIRRMNRVRGLNNLL